MSVWQKSGDDFYIASSPAEVKLLHPGLYIVKNGQMGLFLQYRSNEFKFPYKIYGSQSSFVNRVLNTFNKTSSNLGVLLNGIKGTGKTVTAEQIANSIGLPIIIVTESFDSLPSFINHIQQDICIFFDEFEKIYSDHEGPSILTIMDGVLNNGNKRLFLLTTNKTTINENLISRPGRIRYLKTFGDLDVDTVKEVVDDTLEDKEFRTDCLDFISKLEIITIDIVKSIISEVNLYKESPNEFASIFNVKKSVSTSNVYTLDSKGKKTLLAKNARVYPESFDDSDDNIGDNFHVNGKYRGTISEIIEPGMIEVTSHEDETKPVIYVIEHNPKVHRNFLK